MESVKRFAQAAYEVAAAHNALDRWDKDLADAEVVLSNADFAALVEAPQIPLNVKLEGVRTLLRDVSPQVRNFVSLLVAKRHTRRFASIRREFSRLADEKRGVARADVVTAVPLEPDRRRAVEQALAQVVGKKIVMSERIDPAVLGGVLARVGDRLIDGSTRTRLHELRNSLAVRPG